jgi:predicted RND superfamily exporter protein
VNTRALHARIESGFDRLGRMIYSRRWSVLLGMLLLTGGLLWFAAQMRIDNSTENLLHRDDPARVLYDEFRETFGHDDRIVVGIVAPQIFDVQFLTRLREFHVAVETELPFVEDLTSLWNARFTRGEADELIVGDLAELWPADPSQLATLRDQVFDTPVFRNVLIDDAATLTTLTIKPMAYSPAMGETPLDDFDAEPGSEDAAFLSDAELNQLVDALEVVAERFDGPGFQLFMVGGALETRRMLSAVDRDVRRFFGGASAAVALLLFALFRRTSGVVLPLLVVVPSLGATLGLMVLFGIPASATFQVLPPLLLAVGVCSAIHILVMYYQRRGEGESSEEAIAQALSHSGPAVVMASVTTAGGMVSFAVADVAPIADLGIIAPVGVLFTLLYTVVLIPALLAILPIRSSAGAAPVGRSSRLNRSLVRVGAVSAAYPRATLLAAAGTVAIAALGIAQLRFGHDNIRHFPEGDPTRVASELLDARLGGVSPVEVLIDTGREDGLVDPAVLAKLDRAIARAHALERDGVRVAKALSIVDIVKETHRALNENRADSYVLPRERDLVAQELLLFENSGSDDLSDFVDTTFRQARLTLLLPMLDGFVYDSYLTALERELADALGPELPFEMTGLSMLVTRVFTALTSSMARSYLLALVIVTSLMMLLIGSVRLGLIAMIPNLIPIVLTLGLMGWAGVSVDITNMMIGGIILGLAVDDTIHFMHRFQRYYEHSGDAAIAIRETLETTGAALLFTTLVLGTGFFVICFAYMSNIAWFGGLCCFATLTAFLADVSVGPALMMLTHPGGPEAQLAREDESPVAGASGR